MPPSEAESEGGDCLGFLGSGDWLDWRERKGVVGRMPGGCVSAEGVGLGVLKEDGWRAVIAWLLGRETYGQGG
jgi:hypothetical protein